MAKYIKQEMADLQNKGQGKVFYRMKVERNIGFMEFVDRMCHPASGLSRGEAVGVLLKASDTLAALLADGYSVSLDDWGTFKATLGLVDGKEMDSFDSDEPKRNARSLRVNGVNFQPDKKLVYGIARRCKLDRAGESRLHRPSLSKEERLQRAIAYLKEHKAMKVKHYMALTGLSHTVAAQELREFRCDRASGITTIGRGSSIVYMLSEG